MTTRLRTLLATAASTAVIGCSAGTGTPASPPPGPEGPADPQVSAGTEGSVARPVFDAELDAAARNWVEQTLASLSLRERVGQLIIEWMPGGYVSPSAPDFAPLDTWVTEDRIGGVSPSIGLPHSYVAKINALQERSKVPLLVTADFENGGPGMRINDVGPVFVYQRSDRLIAWPLAWRCQ